MKKNDENLSAKMQPLFEKLGALTMLQRLLIGIAVFALLIGGFVFFSIKPQYETIGILNQKIKDTEQKVAVAKKKADQLDEWKAKWEKKQAEFQIVMNALPDKQEIPTLLSEISAAGRNSGLVFNRFAPKGEVIKDFYAEIPVSISISGSYDRLKLFFNKVAQMSRVVNIRDIDMSMGQSGRRGRKGGGASSIGDINTECTAVTYRFLSEEEKNKANAGKGKKGRKRKH